MSGGGDKKAQVGANKAGAVSVPCLFELGGD